MLYFIIVPVAWLVWHVAFRIKVIGRENLKKLATSGFIIAPTNVSAIAAVIIIHAR